MVASSNWFEKVTGLLEDYKTKLEQLVTNTTGVGTGGGGTVTVQDAGVAVDPNSLPVDALNTRVALPTNKDGRSLLVLLVHRDRSTSGTLDAPTQSVTLGNVSQFRHFTCAYRIANINTSVTVRFEGSLDGTNWFTLMESETLTLTQNGTFNLRFEGVVRQVRFRFLAEAGGTSATINAEILAGNYC